MNPSPFYNTPPTRSHRIPLACSTQISAQPRSSEQHTLSHTAVNKSLPPQKLSTRFALLRFALTPTEKEEHERIEEEVVKTMSDGRANSVEKMRIEHRPSKNDGPNRKSQTIGQRDRKRLQNRMPSNVAFVVG